MFSVRSSEVTTLFFSFLAASYSFQFPWTVLSVRECGSETRFRNADSDREQPISYKNLHYNLLFFKFIIIYSLISLINKHYIYLLIFYIFKNFFSFLFLSIIFFSTLKFFLKRKTNKKKTFFFFSFSVLFPQNKHVSFHIRINKTIIQISSSRLLLNVYKSHLCIVGSVRTCFENELKAFFFCSILAENLHSKHDI